VWLVVEISALLPADLQSPYRVACGPHGSDDALMLPFVSCYSSLRGEGV
jgi:hypothetical protein